MMREIGSWSLYLFMCSSFQLNIGTLLHINLTDTAFKCICFCCDNMASVVYKVAFLSLELHMIMKLE